MGKASGNGAPPGGSVQVTSVRAEASIPQVRGSVVTNDGLLCASLAELGLGLAYAFEPTASAALRSGRLKLVLERYAATVPGWFLYFPSRARSSAPLRLFVDTAREFALRG
jgi:DNA-binding transcriptional LysR family regulator